MPRRVLEARPTRVIPYFASTAAHFLCGVAVDFMEMKQICYRLQGYIKAFDEIDYAKGRFRNPNKFRGKRGKSRKIPDESEGSIRDCRRGLSAPEGAGAHVRE